MSGVPADAELGMVVVNVADIPALERPETTALITAETARMVSVLRALSPDDWGRQTECPLWDVRAMAGHVLGMAQTFSGLRRFATTMRAGGKAAGDGQFVDGLTAVQVEQNASLTSSELVAELAALGPVHAKWRARQRVLRHVPIKQPMTDGTVETWHLAYLFDTVLTRDSWMHRVDIARATGHELELTAAHDGRLVADVVGEWARRHGQPFRLQLTGPAGGRYVAGDGGDELSLDAVEFCRILSGRAPGDGLLSQEVPF